MTGSFANLQSKTILARIGAPTRVTLGHEKMADYALIACYDATYTRMRPSWEPLLPGKWIAIIFAVGAAVTVSLALLGLTNATLLAGMITILIVAALSNGSV